MNCKNFPSLNLLHVVLMENRKEMIDPLNSELLKLLLTLHTVSRIHSKYVCFFLLLISRNTMSYVSLHDPVKLKACSVLHINKLEEYRHSHTDILVRTEGS